MMRLDRLLCECGFGTRSEVKQYIRKGQVSVNGEAVKKPEYKADERSDEIFCQGRRASYAPFTYIMLHKPAGVVSATQDREEKTVLELLEPKLRKGLFPVGRLDKDAEGLLLLTDDGELAHKLLSPKRHVDKTYFVRTDGVITAEHAEKFRCGIDIGEKKRTLPAVLETVKSGEGLENEALVTIREGKFHQIKRMFQAAGLRVLYLKRLSMGTLTLDTDLKPGEYRPLSGEELGRLKELTGQDDREKS